MGSSTTSSYQWDTTGCYTNAQFTPSNPECFPHNQMSQVVTENNLNAEDAGAIICSALINGIRYTSEPFTLRISGEQLVYCIITCIVYCKQCMLLLLATCYCCIIHQLLWFMYRCVFTVGTAVIRGFNFNSANALTDYSHITARTIGTGAANAVIARCVTGLGPSGNDNGVLGGVYFNGSMIPNRATACTSGSVASVGVMQPEPGSGAAGVINIWQCGAFSTAAEGVYTCTMMNSAMMTESIRFGIYFSGRSESLDLCIPSLYHLSSLYAAAPVIDPISPNTMTVNVGDLLALSCTSRGSPPDTFTWQREGNAAVIQSTSITAVDHTSTSAEFQATYSIASVTISGTYTCTVTNPIGSDSATITVTVNSKLLI